MAIGALLHQVLAPMQCLCCDNTSDTGLTESDGSK